MEMKLNENWETELPDIDESARRKQEMITVEMKFELNINRVLAEIADCGDVNISTVQEILDTSLAFTKT